MKRPKYLLVPPEEKLRRKIDRNQKRLSVIEKRLHAEGSLSEYDFYKLKRYSALLRGLSEKNNIVIGVGNNSDANIYQSAANAQG